MTVAVRTFKNLNSREGNLLFLAGRCVIGATGAVGAVTGKGVTIARTDVGDYTLTINNTRNGVGAILYADVNIHDLTGDAEWNKSMRPPSDSGGTVAVTFLNAATPTDPGNGDTLSWFIVVRNTSQT